ncbi:MAG: hypothetical protein AB8H80_00680 [Planctomycetota bacterium]
MPTSTIPYDPSLVLGMIVDPEKITQLEQIADLQLPVDSARDQFNSLLRQKMSLDMTMRELVSLGATPDQLADLKKQIETVMGSVASAAAKLGAAVIKAEGQIAQTKNAQGQKQIGTQLQSPVDFSASSLQAMPLSSDTMDMDVQYFRYEDNEQSSRSTASSISSFVGAKVSSFLGSSYGASAGASAHKASTSAVDNHGVLGTLVICANCTSREAQVFSPLKLDPDAAAESYVFFKGGGKNAMPVESPEQMKALAVAAITKDDQKTAMPVIVGATYGSSFVGFVHFEKVERTVDTQSTQSKAAQARAEVQADLFLESISGSFGMDAQTSSSVKDLMSTSSIQSHCSVVAMGLIPSIKSNQVTSVVKELQNDPAENMKELAAMQTASNDSVASLAAGGAAAKKGKSIEKMKSDYISSSVAAIGKLDSTTNQVIDLNSLMVAFDDYVQKAGDAKTGVPINFYLKYVTKRDIALEWMSKYYPEKLHEKEDAE